MKHRSIANGLNLCHLEPKKTKIKVSITHLITAKIHSNLLLKNKKQKQEQKEKMNFKNKAPK